MKCPYCNNPETQVTDTRETESLEATRRRRECLKCGKRFTTYERVEEAEIIVVKKDGKRERFERQKVINGILKACEKRPIPLEKIEKIVDEVVKINSEMINRVTELSAHVQQMTEKVNDFMSRIDVEEGSPSKEVQSTPEADLRIEKLEKRINSLLLSTMKAKQVRPTQMVRRPLTM